MTIDIFDGECIASSRECSFLPFVFLSKAVYIELANNWLYVSPPRHSGGKITGDTFKSNFVNKNWSISIIISLNSVPFGVIDGKPLLA